MQPIILTDYENPADYGVLVTGLKRLGQITFLFVNWVCWSFQFIVSGPVIQDLDRLGDNLGVVFDIPFCLIPVSLQTPVDIDVFYKLKEDQFIIEKVPTSKKERLKLLFKRGPLYY